MKAPLLHPAILGALFGAMSVFAVGSTIAADMELPVETVRLRASLLGGYIVATRKCTICHSPDYIAYQPPAMSLAQWTAETTKMQHVYGAPISDAEVKQIGAYLAVAYGSAKATDPDVIAASATALNAAVVSMTAGEGGGTPSGDPTAILSANGCLACHAIDHAVVGPAYHDVAMKYQGDAQALAKVSTSIRQGGSGKWGAVSMPPFATMNEADVRSLAEYVLRQ